MKAIIWTPKDMCLKETKLHAQHCRFDTPNNQGDLYDHLKNPRIYTFKMNKIFIRAPEI
jgi:hypothetical protein